MGAPVLACSELLIVLGMLLMCNVSFIAVQLVYYLAFHKKTGAGFLLIWVRE